MKIRRTADSDLSRILEIYAAAREFMAAHGNPKQWGSLGWPPEELVRQDIRDGKSYVCEHEGRVVSVPDGLFFPGRDPPHPLRREGKVAVGISPFCSGKA